MSSNKEKNVKKFGFFMSGFLRHKIVDNKNMLKQMDKAGYIPVSALLQMDYSKSLTINDIKTIVDNDNKSRFSLKTVNDIEYIRANQGHSSKLSSYIDDNLLLPEKITKVDDINICIHGTYKEHVDNIKKSGLNRMDRLHIHLADGIPHYFKNKLPEKFRSLDVVMSGMRSDCTAIIIINMEKALEKMTFYKSENGVVLTRGINGTIPPEYFDSIVLC
jgi:2'-phosphotransferase